MAELVKTILKGSVLCDIEKSNPPNLIVQAKGKVLTEGWTNPVLSRREYAIPPPDGMWEYDLYADRPEGPVPQVESIVEPPPDLWEGFDEENLKGVRVYGEGSGVVEKYL